MAEEVELTQPDVMKLCKAYMNPEHLAFVEKAYKFAAYVIRIRFANLASRTLSIPFRWQGFSLN